MEDFFLLVEGQRILVLHEFDILITCQSVESTPKDVKKDSKVNSKFLFTISLKRGTYGY